MQQCALLFSTTSTMLDDALIHTNQPANIMFVVYPGCLLTVGGSWPYMVNIIAIAASRLSSTTRMFLTNIADIQKNQNISKLLGHSQCFPFDNGCLFSLSLSCSLLNCSLLTYQTSLMQVRAHPMCKQGCWTVLHPSSIISNFSGNWSLSLNIQKLDLLWIWIFNERVRSLMAMHGGANFLNSLRIASTNFLCRTIWNLWSTGCTCVMVSRIPL